VIATVDFDTSKSREQDVQYTLSITKLITTAILRLPNNPILVHHELLHYRYQHSVVEHKGMEMQATNQSKTIMLMTE
jgi:hypothetical protein